MVSFRLIEKVVKSNEILHFSKLLRTDLPNSKQKKLLWSFY